ncbi:hypothetical protein MnTg04_00116 [bacterium MnTg04]|nr:hypothetical protein MnTg04_00116 [bacterium MnTg04]
MVGKSLKRVFVLLCATSVLVACGHGGEEEAPNKAPLISGEPEECILPGGFYDFLPTASDPDGDPLSFGISGKPVWAEFSSANGRLTGTPTDADVGIYTDIRIRASDGEDTAYLSSFSIDVAQAVNGQASLSWTPPITNTDGSTLTDLDAYNIYFGTEEHQYPFEVRVNNPGVADFIVDRLCPNIYYFAVTAINAQGVESDLSNITTIVVL